MLSPSCGERYRLDNVMPGALDSESDATAVDLRERGAGRGALWYLAVNRRSGDRGLAGRRRRRRVIAANEMRRPRGCKSDWSVASYFAVRPGSPAKTQQSTGAGLV
jgi:hypothetical protein